MVVGDSLNLRRNDYGVLNTCSAPFQISAPDRVEVSMIEKDVSGRNNDPQLDEEVWQAWLHKNEGKGRVRLVEPKTLLAIVLVLGIAAMVLWKILR